MTTRSDRFSRGRARAREREHAASRPGRSVRTAERRHVPTARPVTTPSRSRTGTRNWSTGTAFAPRPQKPATGLPRREETRRRQGRLGSRQVVSVRGRRIGSVRVTHRWVKIAGLIVTMLLGGIALAMYLSGVTTQQAFEMQQLTSQESQLENQLETLHRDLADKSSASELARRAQEMNMVVPVQPTVMGPDENGALVEQRPGDATTRPVIDINAETSSQHTASSNPADTRNMADRLAAVPHGERLPSQGQNTPAQTVDPQAQAPGDAQAAAPAPSQNQPGRTPYPPRQQ
ncbi:hypothetical protein L1O03_03675 [Corynebacterium uropygiale]|uniref:Cell division protein FtsL n=1 Tax=Corynebacterium uropygiale TaxID=1775911 RepID=A0A9X1QR22_9CORY|nr:hypothetical protein [Corynebacterium uropygiale]MCF4006278.1 hypothetical protein [Corynebacterium uropygiale]